MATTDITQPNPSKARLPQGKDHLNLAEFPISVLQRKQPRDEDGRKVDTIVYESSTYDRTLRHRVPQKVTLSTSSRLGLPTPADENIVLALLCIAKHTNNFSAPKVYFAPHQLFRTLRWSPNGRSYDLLREVLRRLESLTVRYEHAWWDIAENQYEEEFATGIIAGYKLIRRVKRGHKNVGPTPLSWIRWYPDFYESLRNGNLKQLNLEQLFALHLTTSRRIYRFLDKRFYTNPIVEVDLHDFACGHVGITDTGNVAELKRRLAPAIAELEDIGYIEKAKPTNRYQKVRPGVWRIKFTKKRQAVLPKAAADSEQQASRKPLESELTARGVTAATAATLVVDYPAEQITRHLDIFDWLMENRDRRVSNNPAGYLVKSIQDDYQPPKGFETKAERQAKQEQQRRREEAQRQREAEEEARHQQERERIDAYLNSLTPKQRAKLEQEAIAQAPLFFRRELKQSRTGSMAETIRQSVIDQHVRRLLDEKDQADSTPVGQGSVARPQS